MIRAPRPPPDAAAHQQHMAAALRRLAPATLRAAQADGAALPLAEAITDALDAIRAD